MGKKVEFDFVVAGAGLSGMIAAVAAARRGLKVALINDRSVLGGNASSEIGVRIQGAAHHGLNPAIYSKESGLMEDLRQRLNYAIAYQGFDRLGAMDAVFFDFIYAEPNISLYLNTVVNEVSAENGHLKSISAYQMKTDVTYEFIAPLFADCTGDAIVAYKAGASYMMGSESKEEFGEKWAADQKETFTMGNSIYFEIEDVGHPVKYVRPNFAYDVEKMDFMKDIYNPKKFRGLYVAGDWWTLEYGGQVNTIDDNEAIALELRKLALGLWDHVKNSGRFPQAANYKLKRIHAVAGTRESRRVVGDYILTENDVEQKVRFEDSVAMGGWPMDVHDPEGIYGKLPASNFISVTGTYSIPFRCLYAKDIDNLLLAGRDISVTHVALGSTRIMASCGAFGQAIGTAAALCKKYGETPRGIYQKHIKELQAELVYDDQSILCINDSISPELDQKFKATATSYLRYENKRQDWLEPLNLNYGLALPIVTEKMESVQIKLKNNTDQKQPLTVRVMTGTYPETYLPDTLNKVLNLTIEPNFYGWVTLQTDCPAGPDSKIYLGLERNEALSLCVSEERIPGAVSYKYHDKDHESGYNHDTCPIDVKTGFIGQDWVKFNINFQNILPEQNIFRAENVFNGHSRPYGHMNMWASESVDGQSLILTADQPELVKEMHLILDNSLDIDGKDQISPKMVKDYDVILTTDSGRKVIPVRENFQRHNIIPIGEKVSKIQIDFLTTYGDKSIGVYAVKLVPPQNL